jgi:7-cyano-7-deazaguanine synthase
MNAVVLFSGGIDSSVLLHKVFAHGGYDKVTALTIDYGSLHNSVELLATRRVLGYLAMVYEWDVSIKHEVLELPKDVFGPAQSILTGEDPEAVKTGGYHTSGPQPTVVRFRNGVLISIAAVRSGDVYVAVHATDYGGWAYPDCSPESIGGMAAAIYAGTFGDSRLKAPFNYITKAEIVAIGHDLGTPFHLTWSCYAGQDIHCGKCGTCLERARAFSLAGIDDPTIYEVQPKLKEEVEDVDYHS